jgi:hypothetical protein
MASGHALRVVTSAMGPSALRPGPTIMPGTFADAASLHDREPSRQHSLAGFFFRGLQSRESRSKAAAMSTQPRPPKVSDVVSNMTLETRLDQLSTSLRGFAQLVQRMSTELKDRAETARRLRQEAEDAEALAAQHQDQIDALRRLLRKEMSTELKSTERHILRDSMKIAITSFVLGAAVSILITLLVHPVH